ncbi:MAG: cytochrome-c oxidase, cbb3-type subunit III [Bdellovibrionales bacterium]
MANNDPKKPDAKPDIDAITGVETTGHEWDGIKELNKPAPRWWLWVFYVTVVFSLGYWWVYPAWPTLKGFTGGSQGWSQYEELKQQRGLIDAMRAKYETRFAGASLETIQNDPELYGYARAGGAIAFKNNCAQCHGAGAQGAKGYPNLNDDKWVFGGTLEQIYTTIRYGAHNENPQSHAGAMPPWKDILKPEDIDHVATYVRHMHQGDKAEQSEAYIQGQAVFAKNCVSCHGANGEGSIAAGAPPLNTNIWQWGGDQATITHIITYGRQGVMPAWEGRLDDSTIKQLTIYVHSLGGGK